MRLPSYLHRAAASATLLATIALAPSLSARAGEDPVPPPSAGAREGASAAPRAFPKPADAVEAWLVAYEKNDGAALSSLLGSDAADLVEDGNDPKVAEQRRRIAGLARTAWSFDRTNEAAGVLRIEIGPEHLPMAIPVARGEGGWRFDAAAGRTELLARRIGRNELEAIGLCRQYVEMQVEYASQDRDGDGVREYAQRVVSSPGAQDGLYWETAPGEDAEPSPLGVPLAIVDGAGEGRPPTAPSGGYRWSILKAQGAAAPGGAYGYVVNGNMIAGFALVAAPAEYRLTGVMTFLVSNHGKVFQKDLGPTTEATVRAMDTFDPDPSWAEVPEAADASAAVGVGGAASGSPAVPAPTSAGGALPTAGLDCSPRSAEPRPSGPRVAPTATSPLGSFEVTYADGARYAVSIPDPTTVTWTGLEGTDKGVTGTETVDRRPLAPAVWYVSWQQQDGAVMVQIVDLGKMTVISTRALDGKRTVREGTIRRMP